MSVESFAKSLVGLVASNGLNKVYKIDRGRYALLLEPRPGHAGTKKLKSSETTLEITRFDSLYGYMRIIVDECRVEGILKYGQWYVSFIPQSIDASCNKFSASKVEGIEVEELEEE